MRTSGTARVDSFVPISSQIRSSGFLGSSATVRRIARFRHQTEGDITNKLDGRYVFAPSADGGTEVTYHLEAEMKVPLPGFIKMRAQSRIMSIALRDLKARVESTA